MSTATGFYVLIWLLAIVILISVAVVAIAGVGWMILQRLRRRWRRAA